MYLIAVLILMSAVASTDIKGNRPVAESSIHIETSPPIKLYFVELDHEPRIYAAAPSGILVTRVLALNSLHADTPPTFRLLDDPKYPNDSRYFQIHGESGNITTRRYIDRPAGSAYNILVGAFLRGVKEEKTYTVRVTEYNRLPPVFTSSHYFVDLDINTPVGSTLLFVHAVDKDTESYNAEVYYSMHKQGYMTLDHTSGEIVLRSQIPAIFRNLTFSVIAHDGGSPRRQGRAKVTIAVKLISAPVNVTVRRKGAHKALLCWNGPRSGHTIGYVAFLNSTKAPSNAAAMITYNLTTLNITNNATAIKNGKLCTVLDNLIEHKNYSVRIAGWNNDEIGVLSSETYFDTNTNVSCRSVNITEFECKCISGYYGPNCSFFNPCKSAEVPCKNGARCVSSKSEQYKCHCPEGYYGHHCENFDPCSRSPCQYATKCINVTSSKYQCICLPGYTGNHCEINIDDCEKNPCQNKGTCVDGIAEFQCQCPLGFRGKLCEINVNECMSSPCLNGGTCQDGFGNYLCQCLPGYKGEMCEINIDECLSNPCANNSTCIDGIGEYYCKCNPGYEGRNCEKNTDECLSHPCINGGTCVDLLNDFRCICSPGFSGRKCETDIELCAENPCRNGGICHDNIDHFTCECPAGFKGSFCTDKVMCPKETIKTGQGTFHWVSVEYGTIARIMCPYGPKDYKNTFLENTNRPHFYEIPFHKSYYKKSPGNTSVPFKSNPLHTRVQKNQLKLYQGSGKFISNNDKHQENPGVSFAVRTCQLNFNGSGTWSKMNDSACRDEYSSFADKLSFQLKDITKFPVKINATMFLTATKQVENILEYALINPKIAQNMVLAISNLMDVNNTVIEECDSNGTLSKRLVDVIEKYANTVKLPSSKGMIITSDNLEIQVQTFTLEDIKRNNGTNYIPSHSPIFFMSNDHNEDYISEEEYVSAIFIPSEALYAASELASTVRLYFVSFKNNKFFRPISPYFEDANNTLKETTNYNINYPVIIAALSNITIENLTDPVTYVLQNKYGNEKQVCMYWDYEDQDWLQDGLSTNQSETHITCLSSHLTAFSVLLDPNPREFVPPSHEFTLSIISYIGSAISVLGLILTIITFSLFRCLNRDHSGKILLNLCVSLLLMNCSFLSLTARDQVTNIDMCMCVAILTHYFVLSSLMWMLMEAVNMYQLIIMVFATSETNFLLKRMVIAWGLPLVIVVSTALYNVNVYTSAEARYCFLSSVDQYVYYISHLIPASIILVINVSVFIMVARVIFRKRVAGKIALGSDTGITMAQIRGSFTVMTLLGVTWVFAAFLIGEIKLLFHYFFCISNSLQGALIFWIRCVQNSEARMAWKTFLTTGKLKRHRGVPPSSSTGNSQSRHTISSSTHSQSTRKTSTNNSGNSATNNHSSFWGCLFSHSKSKERNSSKYNIRNHFGSSRLTNSEAVKTKGGMCHEMKGNATDDTTPIAGALRIELEKSLPKKAAVFRTQSMHGNEFLSDEKKVYLKRSGSMKHFPVNGFGNEEQSQINSSLSLSQQSIIRKEGEDTSWQFLRTPQDGITINKSGEKGKSSVNKLNLHEDRSTSSSAIPFHAVSAGIVTKKPACSTDHSLKKPNVDSPQKRSQMKYNVTKPNTTEKMHLTSDKHLNAKVKLYEKRSSKGEKMSAHERSDSYASKHGQYISPGNVTLPADTFVIINGSNIYTNNPSVRLNLEKKLYQTSADVDVKCVESYPHGPSYKKTALGHTTTNDNCQDTSRGSFISSLPIPSNDESSYNSDSSSSSSQSTSRDTRNKLKSRDHKGIKKSHYK